MRPDILLLTVGCSNSTVCVRMLEALGWNAGDADGEYAENREAFRINSLPAKGKPFNVDSCRRLLASLPRPWVLKDPKFCNTLPLWRPALAPYKPLLLWVTKDHAYVRASFVRRFGLSPGLADARFNACRDHFARWPWAKFRLDVQDLCAAARLFDPGRAFQHQPKENQPCLSTFPPLPLPT